MAINVSTLESNLTTKINATSGTTEAKEFLLLGKAVESINTAVSNTSLQPSNNLSDVSDAATARTNLGVDTYVTTQINNVVDAAPGALDTLNELAAALGDDANFSTTVTNSIATKLPLAGGTLTGGLTAPSVTVNGTLDIEEVFEKVSISTSTVGGTYDIYLLDEGIVFLTANQTSNSNVNFVGNGSTSLNTTLGVGQSVTASLLYTQSSTAYYPSTIRVDGTTVTPKWSGGSAPTAGNANSIDVYTFTIIKTADATFTVLASQTQYA